MTVSILAQILRIAGYLPLLAYPAVLIANAMQASALLDVKLRGDVAASRRALMSLFVGGTTIYPLVVLASRALAINASDEARELAWSAAPLAFLGALAALFVFLEKNEEA